MAIARDLSHLPAATPDDGDAPTAVPIIGPAVARQFLSRFSEDKARAIPELPFRFSSASKCTRALAYEITGTAKTNPPDEASAWNMELGTLMHEWIEPGLRAAYPDADISCEEKVDGRPHLQGSGHADAVLRFPDGRTVAVEVKTVNGFKFKMCSTTSGGPPEGPDPSHVAQGALCARAVDADELRIVYLSRENVSPNMARHILSDPVFGRFCAEWVYDRAEYLPLAEREDRRVAYVLETLAQTGGGLSRLGDPATVKRLVEKKDLGRTVEIRDPRKGAWELRASDGEIVLAGDVWNCKYCDWQDRCVADG